MCAEISREDYVSNLEWSAYFGAQAYISAQVLIRVQLVTKREAKLLGVYERKKFSCTNIHARVEITLRRSAVSFSF